MVVNGRRQWGLVSLAAALCAGSPAVLSAGAGARSVSAHAVGAHAAACGGGQSGTSFFSLSPRGSRIVAETDLPVCVTGSLAVTFTGDPAAGCAADGLCDYSGNESYTPGRQSVGDLNITTIAYRGRRVTTATLSIGGPGALSASAVQRTVSTATGTQTTSCSDDAGSGGGLFAAFFNLHATRRHVTIDLARTSPILGSRCAGPLAVDVASAMPFRTVPVRTVQRGDTTIDLSGGGQFAAHGMSGTVASTLMLAVGRPQRVRQIPARKPSGHRRVGHTALIAYRVTRVAGRAVATVQSSTTAALCGPFDGCGLAGTITVLPGASTHGSAFLSALSSHASVRRLRAELRGGGPPTAKLEGGGAAQTHGTVQAQVTQDSATCSDSVVLHQFDLRLARHGHWLRVSLSPSESQAADPLRTRCPGPDLGSHIFATARVPATRLSRRTLTATLRGRAFSDGPYDVTTRSTLAVTLRRGATKVHAIHVIAVRSVPAVATTVGDDGLRVTRAG